ncbi:MAG TPA: hypothetical protein VEW46_21810 [Pyrinomonadaceae bacterium]|nr:hypothetical protein [Pyrinomonadaceae bacterium]
MLDPLFSSLANIDQIAVRNTLLGEDSDSVSALFEFPEEVRLPCEQYLQYFAEFLRDLGVNANTSLVQQAGQVLFTVTPTDQEQALSKASSLENF